MISLNTVGGGSTTPHFVGYDGLGSVRLLADSAGTVSDRYEYEAFGGLLASTGSTPNAYRFTGERYSSALGLYYLRARWYNQGTGRFLTLDTYAGDPFVPPSLHKYLYAHADPVNKVDPSGLMALGETAGRYKKTLDPAVVRSYIVHGVKVSALGAVGIAVLCMLKLATQQLFFVPLEGRCTKYSLTVQYQGDDIRANTPGAVPDTRGGYMVSETLEDNEPIRARQVRRVITEIFRTLNATQKANRNLRGQRSRSAIGRAVAWTMRCEIAGGCRPPGESGFMNAGITQSYNTPRIDIPIHRGLNVVAPGFPTIDIGF